MKKKFSFFKFPGCEIIASGTAKEFDRQEIHDKVSEIAEIAYNEHEKKLKKILKYVTITNNFDFNQ